MPTTIEPVPGDPSTEPVATAQQSHVDGRVGPPTIAQDPTAEAHTPAGVDQIAPGEVAPADTAWAGGPLTPPPADTTPTDDPAVQGETSGKATAARRPGK